MIPRTVKINSPAGGKKLPDFPGVYLMKNSRGKILYVGKAGNLKRRVSSYFNRSHDYRIQKLVSEIRRIDYEKTDTAIEALILESKLIKKHQPPFNVLDKDDKSFLHVEITREEFPRLLLVRGKDIKKPATQGRYFGPFTSASSLKRVLKFLRRVFPWSIHPPEKIPKPYGSGKRQFKRPCFEYEIGLCPGTCIGKIKKTEYRKNIRNVKLFFQGKKKQIIRDLEREMKLKSGALKFEKAESIKRQIFALKHIQDVALITKPEMIDTRRKARIRIEGYDVSNISGTSAVGSMVVFSGNKPNRDQYRKFKIRTIRGPNDVGMLKEVLSRRFKHGPRPTAKGGLGWPLPHLILIDGGRGQVNAAKRVLKDSGLKIPVVGIAKGAKRRKNEFFGIVPPHVDPKTLVKVRDEAHRFAIQYHKKVRSRYLPKRKKSAKIET